MCQHIVLPPLSRCSSAGVADNLDDLNQLKVKALILGPFHTVQTDQASTLNFQAIDPTKGQESDLTALLEKAHKKGMSSYMFITMNHKCWPHSQS